MNRPSNVPSRASMALPRPQAMPMAAVSQTPAAVVSPITPRAVSPLSMVPAQRNPTPATTPWITRLRASSWEPENSGASTNSALPTATIMWVRMPAARIRMGARKPLRQHCQRTAHRHHHVGADAGRLAVVFPLIAEHCSEDGGHAQTENYAGDLFRVEDAAKFIGQGFYDAGPCPHSSSLPVPGSVSFAGTAATGLTQKDFASQVYADGLHPLTADE